MLGLAGLVAFLWSLRSGQYDDLDGAVWRAIADDEPPPQTRQQGVNAPPVPLTSAPPSGRWSLDGLRSPGVTMPEDFA
jgi:cbb3-type cytochrome oxidase maturation protein